MSGVADAVRAARDSGRVALVPFLPAAFADPERFSAIAQACVAAGADILEIGMADDPPPLEGEVVRAAFAEAALVDEEVRRRGITTAANLAPVIAMSHQPTPEAAAAFAQRCAEDGAGDILVPGLALDDQLSLAGSVAPGVGVFVTRREDLAAIATAAATPSFVYLQSARQRTGQSLDTATAITRLRDARAALDGTGIPILVGFGVERPEHAAVLAGAGADGVVVGSALVRRAQDGPDAVADLVATLAGGLVIAGRAS